MLRDKRLLRRLKVLYRREESEYEMLDGPSWVEEHWGLNWFGGHRALWVVKKTHALDLYETWVIRFSCRGAWTLTWDRTPNPPN